MNIKKLGALLAALAVCAIIAAPSARAAEERDAAKAILGKCQSSVISVKATVKMSMVAGGSEQMKEENEVETLATVIDPSGLSVLSYSSIDPSVMFSGIIKKLKAMKDGPKIDMNCDISTVSMVMPDGSEIPARVVLRDPDLDLAFICPKDKQEHPLAALDIAGESSPDVLDTVCIIGRLDKLAGRTPCVSLRRIEAVISNPRKCYVSDNEALSGMLGAPVFAMDGKVVGFSLLRMTKSADKVQKISLMKNGMDALGIMPVILPVAEIAAVAKQAREELEQ